MPSKKTSKAVNVPKCAKCGDTGKIHEALDQGHYGITSDCDCKPKPTNAILALSNLLKGREDSIKIGKDRILKKSALEEFKTDVESLVDEIVEGIPRLKRVREKIKSATTILPKRITNPAAVDRIASKIVAKIKAAKNPMGLNEYGKFVDKRWMGGPPEKLELRDHYIMTVGLAGEVGEVCELLKKHVRDGNPIDHKNLTKELGDVLYYLVRIATAYGIEPQSLLEANVEKLDGRLKRGTLKGSGNDR